MTMYDLTDDDVRQVVTDIFHPVKITNIHRNKKNDTVSCTIHTEWTCGEEIDVIADKVTFRNPFENSFNDAIDFEDGNFPVKGCDLKILEQFCFAKGITPKYLTEENPYLTEKEDEEEKEL